MSIEDAPDMADLQTQRNVHAFSVGHACGDLFARYEDDYVSADAENQMRIAIKAFGLASEVLLRSVGDEPVEPDWNDDRELLHLVRSAAKSYANALTTGPVPAPWQDEALAKRIADLGMSAVRAAESCGT